MCEKGEKGKEGRSVMEWVTLAEKGRGVGETRRPRGRKGKAEQEVKAKRRVELALNMAD